MAIGMNYITTVASLSGADLGGPRGPVLPFTNFVLISINIMKISFNC